jgi:hypothetical protein
MRHGLVAARLVWSHQTTGDEGKEVKWDSRFGHPRHHDYIPISRIQRTILFWAWGRSLQGLQTFVHRYHRRSDLIGLLHVKETPLQPTDGDLSILPVSRATRKLAIRNEKSRNQSRDGAAAGRGCDRYESETTLTCDD